MEKIKSNTYEGKRMNIRRTVTANPLGSKHLSSLSPSICPYFNRNNNNSNALLIYKQKSPSVCIEQQQKQIKTVPLLSLHEFQKNQDISLNYSRSTRKINNNSLQQKLKLIIKSKNNESNLRNDSSNRHYSERKISPQQKQLSLGGMSFSYFLPQSRQLQPQSQQSNQEASSSFLTSVVLSKTPQNNIKRQRVQNNEDSEGNNLSKRNIYKNQSIIKAYTNTNNRSQSLLRNKKQQLLLVTNQQSLQNISIKEFTVPKTESFISLQSNLKIIPGINGHQKRASCSALIGKQSPMKTSQQQKPKEGQEKNQLISPLEGQKLLKCASVQELEKSIIKVKRPEVELSEEDKKLYGDRFIEGYQKISLLGKGGFAAVWMAKKISNGKNYAVKQICKASGGDSQVREMRANNLFFHENGETREEFESNQGVRELVRCHQIVTTQRDIFLVYELGGVSLSKQLYSLKGEFFKGERLYGIQFTALYHKFFETKTNNFLKTLLQKLLSQLQLLSECKLVHADIKPENILISFNSSVNEIDKASLIDFGSCFSLTDKGPISMVTPEYLPPEILEIFLNKNPQFSSTHSNLLATTSYQQYQQLSQIEKIQKKVLPHSIDMWCLGAALFEVLSGVPHWLSYKCRVVDRNNKSVIKYGLFCTKNQDYEKILQKQIAFCENYYGYATDIVNQFQYFETAKRFADLLRKMMKFNPFDRISPSDALQHPFFKIEDNDEIE